MALMPAGGALCDDYTKALNAQLSGASAVLLFGAAGTGAFPGSRLRSTVWKAGDLTVSVPAIGLTYSTAMTIRLANQAVYLRTSTCISIEYTYNVIADLKRSSGTGMTVMVGAHLDSVPEGPGINDNGSGSSLLLHLALLARRWRPTNGLRFAWWAAEEIGLLGSYHYVSQLLDNAPQQLQTILSYLNFDMVGGPNYILLVYNGTEAPAAARSTSTQIQGLFEREFEHKRAPFALTGMTGGSDFLPFILAGIPASGLATGASGIKSGAERDRYGGIANAALDPCYHAPCDTVTNINHEALQFCASAAISVLHQLSQWRVPPRPLLEINQTRVLLDSMRVADTCGSEDEDGK